METSDEVHTACSIVSALSMLGDPGRAAAAANRELQYLDCSICSCTPPAGSDQRR
jgi:hypothetical protein